MLHLLASQTYNPFEDVLALIKALKKKGAKIDITNNNGETPIQIVGTTFYLSKKKNPTQADQQKNAIKNALKRKKS